MEQGVKNVQQNQTTVEKFENIFQEIKFQEIKWEEGETRSGLEKLGTIKKSECVAEVGVPLASVLRQTWQTC